MDKITNNNNAGRLYNAIVDLVLICEKYEKSSLLRSYEQIFEEAFKIEDNDGYELMLRRCHLIQIAEKSIEFFNTLSGNQKLNIKTLQEVMKLFINETRINSSSDITTFKNKCKNILSNLAFVAMFMENTCGETLIEKNELDIIYIQLEETISLTKNSNISKELKNILLGQLFNMRNNIDKYDLYGITGIQDAINNMMGVVVLNQKKVKNEEDKRIFKKSIELLETINTAVEFATNVAVIGLATTPIIQNLIGSII